MQRFHSIIPAKAGIQARRTGVREQKDWIPAFAGMTELGDDKNSLISRRFSPKNLPLLKINLAALCLKFKLFGAFLEEFLYAVLVAGQWGPEVSEPKRGS